MSRLVLFVLLVRVAVGAADLNARRMEIVQTPEGQETVFRDSVRIVDGATRIFAGLARFNESRGRATISDSVFIEDAETRVWADSAIYYFDGQLTELYGAVRVELDSVAINAPRLLYSVGERRVDAEDGLTITTLDHGFEVTGARGRYFMDRRVGEVDSLPVLVLDRQADGGEEPVTATARKMTWFDADETALLAGDVRVGTGASALTADSLRYWIRADTGLAWGDPRIADTLSSTEGDTIGIEVVGGSLHRVRVSGDARGRYATAGANEVEVAGGVIRIRLDAGELDVIEVERMSRGWLVTRAGNE